MIPFIAVIGGSGYYVLNARDTRLLQSEGYAVGSPLVCVFYFLLNVVGPCSLEGFCSSFKFRFMIPRNHFLWGQNCVLVAIAMWSLVTVRAAAPKKPAHPSAKPSPKAAKRAAGSAAQKAKPAVSHAFLEENCLGCHDAETKKGGLNLAALKLNLNDARNFAAWTKVHDRVLSGEMPPKSKLSLQQRAAFTKPIAAALMAAEQAQLAANGRAVWRRLNRYEYENTVRDLLQAPWLQLKDMLPEDGEAYRFNKVGEALDVSHVQMARYLNAADYALRAVMANRVAQPATINKRYYTREEGAFAGAIDLGGPLVRRTIAVLGTQADKDFMVPKTPMTVGAADPQRREQEGMGVVVSTYEPTEIHWGRFRAPVAGRYKLRFSTHSIWIGPESAERWWLPDFSKISPGRRTEPITIYSDKDPRILRKLGSFDAQPQPTTQELDVYLLAGESIRPDAARLFRARPPEFRNPLAEKDGMPGVSFRWMEVEGPLFNQWPSAGHKLLFSDLPLKPLEKNRAEVTSSNPQTDASRLLRTFLQRAYRRPVNDADVARFLPVVSKASEAGYSFSDAMIAGYTAVLCSPGFLYLEEKPGRLDGYALASRLSYFLWNSPPDDTLRALAANGQLAQPKVLRAQTERLLNDKKSGRFIEAFLDYWLDLRRIAANDADETLYPDYQLDDLLLESSLGETQEFFAELLRRNLGVKNIAASDFAMLNERLATHYGVPGDIHGVTLRRVTLPPDSPRGGLLTQASVLKVTANGTSTSPVLRGAWIMERVLGQPSPPPPPGVGSVEPDIRGATTIREQLAKHTADPSCASCHRNIDPAGFALESFDVMGGWRENYRSLGTTQSDKSQRIKGVGRNGSTFTFYAGPPVNSSGQLPDGRTFKDVRELKQLLAKNDVQLARNLAKQLLIYSTGTAIRFADRDAMETILTRARPSGYGVRTLVHEIVQSRLFQTK
ncbi:MAG: hypothetical protein JWN98_160 [Abditibacteriota bacterium]|nr:hypothetical protein [Abditibacteriota bacterium]